MVMLVVVGVVVDGVGFGCGLLVSAFRLRVVCATINSHEKPAF